MKFHNLLILLPLFGFVTISAQTESQSQQFYHNTTHIVKIQKPDTSHSFEGDLSPDQIADLKEGVKSKFRSFAGHQSRIAKGRRKIPYKIMQENINDAVSLFLSPSCTIEFSDLSSRQKYKLSVREYLNRLGIRGTYRETWIKFPNIENLDFPLDNRNWNKHRKAWVTFVEVTQFFIAKYPNGKVEKDKTKKLVKIYIIPDYNVIDDFGKYLKRIKLGSFTVLDTDNLSKEDEDLILKLSGD